MHKLLKQLLSISILITAVTGVLFLTSGESRAQQGPCVVEVTKIAEGAPEGQLFDFQVEVDGNIGFAQFPTGITAPASFDQGSPVTVTELPNPGWRLADVSCETGPGVSITEIEGGAIFECLDPGEGIEGECTFVNVRVPTDIPTLSEWGMIAAAAGLMLVGVFFAVKRLRASKQSDAIG
jgi:hypothetical protein